MTQKFKDNSENGLQIILNKLEKNNTPYKISVSEGKIVYLETDNAELISYSKKSNPNIKKIK